MAWAAMCLERMAGGHERPAVIALTRDSAAAAQLPEHSKEKSTPLRTCRTLRISEGGSAMSDITDAGITRTGSVHVGVAQRTIGTYEDFWAACRAVDVLRDADFAVERTTIMAAGLHTVDREQGRLSTVDVTRRGALSGLLIGAAVGWILRLFELTETLIAMPWLVVNAAVLGAILGAAVALLGYVITQGRRSFVAVQPVRAERYHIVVDADLADNAVHVLRTISAKQSPT